MDRIQSKGQPIERLLTDEEIRALRKMQIELERTKKRIDSVKKALGLEVEPIATQ